MSWVLKNISRWLYRLWHPTVGLPCVTFLLYLRDPWLSYSLTKVFHSFPLYWTPTPPPSPTSIWSITCGVWRVSEDYRQDSYYCSVTSPNSFVIVLTHLEILIKPMISSFLTFFNSFFRLSGSFSLILYYQRTWFRRRHFYSLLSMHAR